MRRRNDAPWRLYRARDFVNDPPSRARLFGKRTPCIYLLAREERGWPRPDRPYWLVKVGKTQRDAFKRASECRHKGFEVAAYWPILYGRVTFHGFGRPIADRRGELAWAEAEAIGVMKERCSREPSLGIEFYRTGVLVQLVHQLDAALKVSHVALHPALAKR